MSRRGAGNQISGGPDKKIIDLPGGQINYPSSGKNYSLLFLPATPWSLSGTLEGNFGAETHIKGFKMGLGFSDFLLYHK